MYRNVQNGMLSEILGTLGLAIPEQDDLTWVGDDRLPSCFPVTELAAASIGSATLAVSELVALMGRRPAVSVDLRLASLWFGFSVVPQGWTVPAAWDEIAGDYRSKAGWIKLHTNATHHKAAVLHVLACKPTRDAVAGAVASWDAEELEQAVVDAGGCAAKLRERSEWQQHPQGRAVACEPLVLRTPGPRPTGNRWRPTTDRPLAGIRILDLTRILAGPVATRFLASYGAEVLRIDPPGWDEPSLVAEITPGKRCARLDLRDRSDRSQFEALLSKADVLVHGYRSDALENLGLGADVRQAIRPGLIDVSLDAYGHSGPWKHRRGFDSLVQFSSGVAAEGRRWKGTEAPASLPVQALDHATGYLMAAAAIRGLIARLRGDVSERYQFSLARTAELLFRDHADASDKPFEPVSKADLGDHIEDTDWGSARRIKPPASVEHARFYFETGAIRLGSAPAEWVATV